MKHTCLVWGVMVVWLSLLTACQPVGRENVLTTTQPGADATQQPGGGQTNEENVMTITQPFEITYGASGGQPPVSASLQIGADGQAELFLGSSWSVPTGTDTVGYFKGQVAAAKLKDLHNHLTHHNLMTRSGGAPPTSPDPATRYLRLVQNGQQTDLTLTDTTKDPPVAALEEMLIGIMNDLTTQPLRAVQVKLNIEQDEADAMLHPTITLAHVGPEPLPVLLFDPAQVNMYLRANLSLESLTTLPSGIEFAMPLGGTALSRDQVVALVEQGVLPSGPQELSGNQTFTSHLPPSAQPQAEDVHARGTLTFWLPGQNGQGHVVTVQTPRLALKP